MNFRILYSPWKEKSLWSNEQNGKSRSQNETFSTIPLCELKTDTRQKYICM
jgi:hypothetical protein